MKTLSFSPELATKIGLNEAIVYQKLKELQGDNEGVTQTVDELRKEYFMFFSEKTLRRIFTKLKTIGCLQIKPTPNRGFTNKKLYAIRSL